MEGLKILKSEVRSALAKLNRNKTAGSNGIVIEILAAFQHWQDYGNNKLNKDSGVILEDLSRSIFVAWS